MGDREKASLRLQFNPQIRLELPGWSYMAPPSPPTPNWSRIDVSLWAIWTLLSQKGLCGS